MLQDFLLDSVAIRAMGWAGLHGKNANTFKLGIAAADEHGSTSKNPSGETSKAWLNLVGSEARVQLQTLGEMIAQAMDELRTVRKSLRKGQSQKH